VTWSDRDWDETMAEDDSDADVLADLAYGQADGIKTGTALGLTSTAALKGNPSGGDEKVGKEVEMPKRTSSPVWNWPEKIVGKGTRRGGGSKVAKTARTGTKREGEGEYGLDDAVVTTPLSPISPSPGVD
jgi:hypothetical protein